MLKFSIKPKIGYKLLYVSRDEAPFAKIWTYPKSPAWYVSIKEKRPRRFLHKQKQLALNNALKFVEDKAEKEGKNHEFFD